MNKRLLTYLLTYLLIYLLTYLLIYLLTYFIYPYRSLSNVIYDVIY